MYSVANFNRRLHVLRKIFSFDQDLIYSNEKLVSKNILDVQSALAISRWEVFMLNICQETKKIYLFIIVLKIFTNDVFPSRQATKIRKRTMGNLNGG